MKYANLVKERSNTAGSGSYALDGNVVNGYQRVQDVLLNGDQAIWKTDDVNAGGSDAEIFIGTWNSGTNTLSRDTILMSTQNDEKVNWDSRSKEVSIVSAAHFYQAFDVGTNATEGTVKINDKGVGIGDYPLAKLDIVNTGGRFIRTGPNGNKLYCRHNDNNLAPTLYLENTQGGSPDYGSALRINLGYGGSASASGTAVNAGEFGVGASNSWTSTATTHNSYARISTAKDGVLSEKVRVDSSGCVLVGTTNSPVLSGHKAICLGNNDGPVLPGAGSAAIYGYDDDGTGDGVEVWVSDEAGNSTRISPHNEAGEWEFYSYNVRTGRKVRINMEKLVRKIENLTGEQFMFEE